MMNGYLKVDDKHFLYYEWIGDKSKPTIIFLHGGPGLGFSEKDKELFDFQDCNVLFFDQRGSKRSTPTGSLIANTTKELLEDLDFLIAHFQIQQPILVGGSWGSTLALLYAIRQPNRVQALVLRGLFLACKESRIYFEQGGTQEQFPLAWKLFKRPFNDAPDDQIMIQYWKGILDHPETANELSIALNLYGAMINYPNVDWEKALAQIKESVHLAKSKILCHFSRNDFFIPERFIQNHLNLLAHIPITIIHGKADHVTPISLAQRVASEHNNIILIETEEGHSAHSDMNQKELKKAIKELIFKS
jgi:proline iminopeptidase